MKIPPEEEYGPIEYKWSLCSLNPKKLMKLGTQMLWRVAGGQDSFHFNTSGQGVALYYIGVCDNGVCKGLSKKDLGASIKVLIKCAKSVRLKCSVKQIIKVNENNYIAIVQVYSPEEDSEVTPFF